MEEQITDQIKNLEFSEKGGEKPKTVHFIYDNQQALVLNDSSRAKILNILKTGIDDTVTTIKTDNSTGDQIILTKSVTRKILSAIEIVKQSRKIHPDDPLTRNQVNHHLDVLIKAGLVIRAGTITKGKRVTYYYRRIAGQFIITDSFDGYGRDFVYKMERKRVEKIASTFSIPLTRDEKEELTNLRTDIQLLQDRWRGSIARLVKDDVSEEGVIELYHWLLDIYAAGSDDYRSRVDKMRSILFKKELGDNGRFS
ncbi:MAG: hypothetical protein ACFFD4_19840 [Candidatus Odinarchaeota archaeon]